jgi:hypothetical protein
MILSKIYIILLSMLLVISVTSFSAIAGDPDNPELEDRKFDVRLLGLLPIFPQSYFENIDVISAWFYEEHDTPDYLYVSLKIRNLESRTDSMQATYVVSWIFNNHRFSTISHVFPDAISGFEVARSMDGDDDLDECIYCDGVFDDDNNIITWIVPKDWIGNLRSGDEIYSPSAHAIFRFTTDSGLPRLDFFKDLSNNAKTKKDYTVLY